MPIAPHRGSMLLLCLFGFLSGPETMNYAWYYNLDVSTDDTTVTIQPKPYIWMPSFLARAASQLAPGEAEGHPHVFDLFNFPAIASGGMHGAVELTLVYQVRDTAGALVDEQFLPRRIVVRGPKTMIRAKRTKVCDFASASFSQLQSVAVFLSTLAAPEGSITLNRPINRDFVVDLVWTPRLVHRSRPGKKGSSVGVLPMKHRHPIGTAFVRDRTASESTYLFGYRETVLAQLKAFKGFDDPAAQVQALTHLLALNPGNGDALTLLMRRKIELGREEEAWRLARRWGPLMRQEDVVKAVTAFRAKREDLLARRGQFAQHPTASVTITAPETDATVAGMVGLAFNIEGTSREVLRVDCLLGGKPVASLDEAPFRTRISTRGYQGKETLTVRPYFYDETYAETEITIDIIPVDDNVEVHLTPLRAVVTHKNQFLTQLDAVDFEAHLGKKVLGVTRLERETGALRISLLLDASVSMQADRLLAAQHAAYRFLENLEAPDEAELLAFDHKILRVHPFTHDPAKIYPGLFGLDARGGTALHDAILVAAEHLRDRDGVPVIIVVSDGKDQSSLAKIKDVRERLKQSGIMLYAISLGDMNTELAQLSRATGSVYSSMDLIDDLTGTLERIYQELKSYYYVEITTAVEPDMNKLKLKLKGKGGKVRIRPLPGRR